METTKHKKEVMQVAKKNILFILLFCTWNAAHTQSMVGKFQRKDPATAARGIAVKFLFKEGQKFERMEYKHLGTQEKSHGTYHISEDTLILNYEHYQEPLGNSVEITHKKKISPVGTDLESLPLYSLIQVLQAPGIPKSGVNLLLRNADQEVVMAFISDKEGFFPDLSLYDHYIEAFQISALGKQEIVIDTDELFGFKTRIKIIFEDSSRTRISKHTLEKFLIKNITGNRIELLPLGERELVQLEKITGN